MSVRYLEQRVVSIARLVLPGDMKRRMEAPHVKELSKSLGQVGLIHLPVVEAKTMRLVAGRDRVAALMLAGATGVEVRFVEGPREALDALELRENLHRRRDDEAAMRARLVELEKKRVVEFETQEPAAEEPGHDGDEPEGISRTSSYGNPASEGEAPRRRGRPRSAAKLAREKVAAELGIQEDSLRRHLKAAEAKKGPEAEPGLPIDTMGIVLSEETKQRVLTAAEQLERADQLMRQVQATLSRLEGSVANARLKQLIDAAHQVAVDVRRAKPVRVCPYCKETVLRKSCMGCEGVGYTTEGQDAWIPADIKDAELDYVMRDGKPVPRSEVLNG